MLDKYEQVINALVLKVKEGGNEGVNAKRALAKLCKKYGLDVEDVLSGVEKAEDRWYAITPATKTIVVQCILRYGGTRDIYGTRGKKHLVAAETLTQHLEISNAIDVLLPLYRKEMRRIKRLAEEAFVHKHDLFWKGEREERIGDEPEKTLAELREEMERGAAIGALTRGMQDAEVHKRLN